MNVLVYTHRNPVHHGFCNHYDEWEYSSYKEITNRHCDLVEVNKLLKLTGNMESFKEIHRQALDNFINNQELEIPNYHD